MRVVVSGASGLIGSALVPACAPRATRSFGSSGASRRGADEVRWDPAAGHARRRCARGRRRDREPERSEPRPAVDRRRASARSCESRVDDDETSSPPRRRARADGRPSFVCAGGAGVYGNRGDEILTEESERGSGIPRRRRCERPGRRRRSPLARPACASSTSGRASCSRATAARSTALLPFKLGLGGRVGSGRQWWSWVSLGDVVAAYRFASLASDSPAPSTSPRRTR